MGVAESDMTEHLSTDLYGQLYFIQGLKFSDIEFIRKYHHDCSVV